MKKQINEKINKEIITKRSVKLLTLAIYKEFIFASGTWKKL